LRESDGRGKKSDLGEDRDVSLKKMEEEKWNVL
jgi:hypothetical protein